MCASVKSERKVRGIKEERDTGKRGKRYKERERDNKLLKERCRYVYNERKKERNRELKGEIEYSRNPYSGRQVTLNPVYRTN